MCLLLKFVVYSWLMHAIASRSGVSNHWERGGGHGSSKRSSPSVYIPFRYTCIGSITLHTYSPHGEHSTLPQYSNCAWQTVQNHVTVQVYIHNTIIIQTGPWCQWWAQSSPGRIQLPLSTYYPPPLQISCEHKQESGINRYIHMHVYMHPHTHGHVRAHTQLKTNNYVCTVQCSSPSSGLLVVSDVCALR